MLSVSTQLKFFLCKQQAEYLIQRKIHHCVTASELVNKWVYFCHQQPYILAMIQTRMLIPTPCPTRSYSPGGLGLGCCRCIWSRHPCLSSNHCFSFKVPCSNNNLHLWPVNALHRNGKSPVFFFCSTFLENVSPHRRLSQVFARGL